MIPGAYRLDFERTLYAGGYNLLLGSGISLKSKNVRGADLQSADDLRKSLCTLKGVSENTSLARVTTLLNDSEIRDYLLLPFQGCGPHESLYPLRNYLWRRAFTFNIDDVVENLYLDADSKQILSPVNYDDLLEPTPIRRNLQLVHLHGYVNRPDSRFVFSRNDYANVMRENNSWMHLLSQILATEPFIIAGTSLDEPDLEYYLSYRNTNTPQKERGPSLLIEPFPNALTELDCERHGLILVKAKFGDFLNWLRSEYPLPPTVSDLIIPQGAKLFRDIITPAQTLQFYSDFQLVCAAELPLPSLPSKFMNGREPTWEDMNCHVDIQRTDNASLAKAVNTAFENRTRPALILLIDDAGAGKSTTIKRVAHQAASLGRVALSVSTVSRIDIENAITCLSESIAPVLLLVDGFADHSDQIAEILVSTRIKTRLVVLAAERKYRIPHIDATTGHIGRTQRTLTPFLANELSQLIERYRRYGLLAQSQALKAPSKYIRNLQSEAIAITICRLMNDYRPLESIVESLWNASAKIDKLAYLCAALSHYCYSEGIDYSVLQAALGREYSLSTLFDENKPLRIAGNATHDEYVVPLNSVISERVLRLSKEIAPDLLADCFKRIAKALAPRVNRTAVLKRTPEARLAGRLFDADKITKQFLGTKAEQFYIDVATDWEWNSRYWEQRALLVLTERPNDALSYARHAVAIERHPHPLTTLGKILIEQMQTAQGDFDGYFLEAFDALAEAISAEVRHSRVSVHPYSTLFSGVIRFARLGGNLGSKQRERLFVLLSGAEREFSHDLTITKQVKIVREHL